MAKTKTHELTVEVPLFVWQSLVAMAAEDLRTPSDFLVWIAWREACSRGWIEETLRRPEEVHQRSENG